MQPLSQLQISKLVAVESHQGQQVHSLGTTDIYTKLYDSTCQGMPQKQLLLWKVLSHATSVQGSINKLWWSSQRCSKQVQLLCSPNYFIKVTFSKPPTLFIADHADLFTPT